MSTLEIKRVQAARSIKVRLSGSTAKPGLDRIKARAFIIDFVKNPEAPRLVVAKEKWIGREPRGIEWINNAEAVGVDVSEN